VFEVHKECLEEPEGPYLLVTEDKYDIFATRYLKMASKKSQWTHQRQGIHCHWR